MLYRCPTYQALRDGCTLLTDPNDQCCQAPLCINQTAQNPLYIATGIKGSITGGTPTDVISNTGQTNFVPRRM